MSDLRTRFTFYSSLRSHYLEKYVAPERNSINNDVKQSHELPANQQRGLERLSASDGEQVGCQGEGVPGRGGARVRAFEGCRFWAVLVEVRSLVFENHVCLTEGLGKLNPALGQAGGHQGGGPSEALTGTPAGTRTVQVLLAQTVPHNRHHSSWCVLNFALPPKSRTYSNYCSHLSAPRLLSCPLHT